MGPISRDLRMLPYGALVWQESRATTLPPAELHTEMAATVAHSRMTLLADVAALSQAVEEGCGKVGAR